MKMGDDPSTIIGNLLSLADTTQRGVKEDLHTIEFDSNLKSAEIKAICESLGKIQQNIDEKVARNIVITVRNISGETIKALADNLLRIPHLASVTLSHSAIHTYTGETLAQLIATHPTLSQLHLTVHHESTKKIAVGACGHIAAALATNPDLSELKIEGYKVNDDSVNRLSQALMRNNQLKVLSLPHNEITSAGLAALGTALKSNKGLMKLDLSNNQIAFDDRNLSTFSEGFSQNLTLQELYLSHNTQFGTLGAKAIFSCLTKQPLRTLSLEATGLDENFGELLKVFVDNRSQLANLYINKNPRIIEHLQVLTQLIYNFSLLNVEIGSAAKQYFADSLKTRKDKRQANLLLESLDDIFANSKHFAAKAVEFAKNPGHLNELKYKLEQGVPLYHRDDQGYTLLHHAAKSGDVEMVQMLLEKRLSPLVVNNDGRTPKDLAADPKVRDLLSKYENKSHPSIAALDQEWQRVKNRKHTNDAEKAFIKIWDKWYADWKSFSETPEAFHKKYTASKLGENFNAIGQNPQALQFFHKFRLLTELTLIYAHWYTQIKPKLNLFFERFLSQTVLPLFGRHVFTFPTQYQPAKATNLDFILKSIGEQNLEKFATTLALDTTSEYLANIRHMSDSDVSKCVDYLLLQWRDLLNSSKLVNMTQDDMLAHFKIKETKTRPQDEVAVPGKSGFNEVALSVPMQRVADFCRGPFAINPEPHYKSIPMVVVNTEVLNNVSTAVSSTTPPGARHSFFPQPPAPTRQAPSRTSLAKPPALPFPPSAAGPGK